MKQAILDPLGMEDTYFRVPAEKQHRVATIYDVSPEGNISLYDFSGSVSGTFDLSMADMGGGGLYSTLDDFARFGEMLRKDGDGLLRPESVREMKRSRMSGKSEEQFSETGKGYGYGWLVRNKLRPEKGELFPESVGSFGWNGKAATTLRMDPARGLTIVFGVQRVPARSDELHPVLMKAVNEVWPVEG
jgi:CubicO group peptidase (beta-lactamase class C family)